MISKEKKTAVINEYARFEGDTGSPEVQIAILTARISISPATAPSRRLAITIWIPAILLPLGPTVQAPTPWMFSTPPIRVQLSMWAM
jgi:hypothetical protein